MTSQWNRTRLLAATLCVGTLATAAVGCRSPRKGVRTGATTAELKVTMLGLSPEDEGRKTWLYKLSGCVSSDLNGELKEGNVVSFKAPGLKKGLEGCQLRVALAEVPPNVRFRIDTEPGVLYWARDLRLEHDATGQLVARATLDKLYALAGDSGQVFTLKIPVQFPAPLAAGDAVRAVLDCTPEVIRPGEYKPSETPGAGELTFLIGADVAASYACRSLEVAVGARTLPNYRATFAASAGKFSATAGGEAAFAKAVLQKIADEPGEPEPPTDPEPLGDVTVTVPTAEKCEPPKTFDYEERVCK